MEGNMADLSGLVQGLSQGLNQYLQGNIQQKRQEQETQFKSQVETQQAEDLAKFSQGQQGVITPEMGQQMFSQVSPEFGQAAFKAIGDFKQAKGRDMTLDEANKFMDPVMKGLMMKQSKQAGVSDKEEEQQNKLEKDYADRLQKVVSFRSGGLGLTDQKVDQARQLRVLLNSNYDPKTGEYNIPPSLHSELALGLARLMSGTGQVPLQLEEQLRQKTGREALSSAMVYFGMDPQQVGGPTQSVIKLFKDSIDRQGLEAERQRDQYMKGLRGLRPTKLKKERADALESAQLTNSYKDVLNESPEMNKHLDTHPIGRVPVISPDGKTRGTIPAEQLEEALQNGYTQAK
jgi:hypothetical protein